MSLADTSNRGAALNARLFVNGIQSASSDGWFVSGAWSSAPSVCVSVCVEVMGRS